MKKILIILFFAINSSLFAQTLLTIEGQTYVNSDPSWKGIIPDWSTPTTFTFRNNSITCVNSGAHMLSAGGEASSAWDNNLDGEVITGNKITWNGTGTPEAEALLLGYNKNQIVEHNYLDKTPYAAVFKSGNSSTGNMKSTSGSFAYNIVRNAIIAVRVKGMNGVPIYNNTFYDDANSSNAFIYISTNPDNGNAASTGTIIENNIFYTTTGKAMIYAQEPGDLSGLACDYNVYYSTTGNPKFYNGSSWLNFSQWRALGYDTHSVVVNPNFINFTDFVPSIRLDYGTDLGAAQQTGLSVNAVWGITDPATANQNGIWQVGARIYATKVYYVSPTGTDATGNGSIVSPWFTLNKAWHVVSAGDVVYMRGGTYRYRFTGTSLTGKSGVSGNYIKIWAYPGEYPIINYDDHTFTSQLIGIYLNGVSYIHLKGIRVTSINQPIIGNIAQYGLILWDDVNNCIFEQIETDHIGGWGIVVGDNSSNNLFLNCDSHHNADPYTSNGDPYGWSDGFESGSLTSTNNILRGCRLWSNSDDGLDLRRANGIYTIENCWSFWNGYVPGTFTSAGDGTGYKLGGKSAPATTNILRTIKNSLAFGNKGTGFDPQPDAADLTLGVAMYNCTAYDNASIWGDGFSVGGYNNTTIIKNCLDYNNHGHRPDLNSTNVVHNHNSFDIPLTVTDADFVSVNSAGVDGPRQADGSLPKLDFLKLSPASKLIDAGIDVGLPFAGASPDLGAFETGMVTGISPKEIKNDFFRVYPNPVKDILYISAIRNDAKLISLKLYDIRGVKLYESNETGDCKLDFSRYRSGLYFLQIMSEGNLTIDKIVKY